MQVCNKCGQQYGEDGSPITTATGVVQPDNTKMYEAIIGRQEIELERLRVDIKAMREAMLTATKALDMAREVINKATPFGIHF